jgi:hypothetical protein
MRLGYRDAMARRDELVAFFGVAAPGERRSGSRAAAPALDAVH